MDIPELGAFAVKVFTDGFVVQHIQDGDSLEIIGVGHPMVLIRYLEKPAYPNAPVVSRTIMGTRAGVVECSFRLMVDGLDEHSLSGNTPTNDASLAEKERKLSEAFRGK